MHSQSLSKSRQDYLHTNFSQEKLRQRKAIDEIQQLSKDIRSACEKNRSHYNRIIKQNPYFSHRLYNPPIHLNTNKSQIHLTKNLLVRQLDNLLEEENKFLREMNKIHVREEEQQFSKQCNLDKKMGHYMFLRNVWKRNIEAVDSEDRIQKLNKSVALIKGQILTMGRRQSAESMVSNDFAREMIINSPEYLQLKQNFEKMVMEREEYMTQGSNGRLHRKLSANSAGEDPAKLQEENQQLKAQIQQFKEKSKNLEKVALKSKIRMQELQEQIYSKEREIHKLTKDIRIIYRNDSQRFQLQILSKNLTGKEEKKISKTLEELLQLIESVKQPSDNPVPELDLHLNISSQTKSYSNLILSARTPVISQNNGAEDQPTQNSSENPTNKLLSSERKRFSHIHLDIANPHHTRRLKSIADTNVETEMKKARFIRTITRNNPDEQSTDGKEKY